MIFNLLSQNGGEGRIVGGAVRDHLLDEPIGDIDFCSTHRPDKLIELATKNNIRTIETGVKYGTITLIVDGECFEVTTLRADVNSDGRHAKVIYGVDFTQDAKRRDFTFNALYITSGGAIIDPLGSGIKDVEQKKIRFIGNAAERITEDYLRILRYFRFIARFGLNIDQADYDQIAPLVSGLKQLSAERLLHEFRRIYQSQHQSIALKLMADCGIFEQLFDAEINLKPTEYLASYQKQDDDLWLIKLVLSLPQTSTKQLIDCLKLSNKQQKILHQLAKIPSILSIDDDELAKDIYQYGKQTILLALIYQAANVDLTLQTFYKKQSFIEQFTVPIFPVKGADLLALGMQSGPKMGITLKHLEQLWLNDNFGLSKQKLLMAI